MSINGTGLLRMQLRTNSPWEVEQQGAHRQLMPGTLLEQHLLNLMLLLIGYVNRLTARAAGLSMST